MFCILSLSAWHQGAGVEAFKTVCGVGALVREWHCLKGVCSLSDAASALSDPASVVTPILLKATYLCVNLLLFSLSYLHWY